MAERLTEKEIIKGLEYCCCDDYCGGCECPYYLNSSCIKALACDALWLINTKRAEIEYLDRVIQTTAECAYESRQMAMKWARAEAIKEIFEKLGERLFVHSFKTKSDDYTQGQVDCMDFVDSKIEELKKEMVGDEGG